MIAAAPWTGVRGKWWNAAGDAMAAPSAPRVATWRVPYHQAGRGTPFPPWGCGFAVIVLPCPATTDPRRECHLWRLARVYQGEKRCKVSNSRSLNHLFGTRGCLRASVRRFGRGSSSGGYPCSQSNHCGRAVGLGAIAPCAWAPMRRSRRRLPVANLGAFTWMISNCAKSHARWLARGCKACPRGRCRGERSRRRRLVKKLAWRGRSCELSAIRGFGNGQACVSKGPSWRLPKRGC
jgi:hypothetical protein